MLLRRIFLFTWYSGKIMWFCTNFYQYLYLCNAVKLTHCPVPMSTRSYTRNCRRCRMGFFQRSELMSMMVKSFLMLPCGTCWIRMITFFAWQVLQGTEKFLHWWHLPALAFVAMIKVKIQQSSWSKLKIWAFLNCLQ